MLVPPVTLEDLQAFHEKHFPGLPNPIGPAPQPAEDYPAGEYPCEEYGEDEEVYDDGLGYYPDGVKRTLTDEQIALFRHSEIFKLLRQRELQKDARELEERQRVLGRNYNPMPDSPDSEQYGKVKSRGSVARQIKRCAKNPDRSTDIEASFLDYDEVNTESIANSTPATTIIPNKPAVQSHPQFQGRKIISYEDGGDDVNPAPTKRPVQPRPQFQGRKLISYDD